MVVNFKRKIFLMVVNFTNAYFIFGYALTLCAEDLFLSFLSHCCVHIGLSTILCSNKFNKMWIISLNHL